ncbi:MAG: MarR family winged helix-turn-helix transcriptional regulator [Clostridia bacterium]
MQDLHRWNTVLHRYATKFLDKELETLGLNYSYAQYILHICIIEGIEQEKLTSHLNVHRSSVTRAISYLIENGFVIKKNCLADKRTNQLFPTKKAQDAYICIQQAKEKWNNIISSNFTQEEITQFFTLLQKAKNNAYEYLYPSK